MSSHFETHVDAAITQLMTSLKEIAQFSNRVYKGYYYQLSDYPSAMVMPIKDIPEHGANQYWHNITFQIPVFFRGGADTPEADIDGFVEIVGRVWDKLESIENDDDWASLDVLDVDFSYNREQSFLFYIALFTVKVTKRWDYSPLEEFIYAGLTGQVGGIYYPMAVKFDGVDMTEEAVLYADNTTGVNKTAVTVVDDYTYMCGTNILSPNSRGAINKILTSDWSLTSTLQLGSDETSPTDMLHYDGYLYVLCKDSDGEDARIVKIDISTFTKTDTLELGVASIDAARFTRVGAYLFISQSTIPGGIIRVNLTTFTKEDDMIFEEGEDYAYEITSDDTYVYCVLDVDLGTIIRIDAATFTRVDVLTLDEGDEFPRESVISEGYLYLATYTIPSKIIKIKLSTFTKESSLTLNANEDQVRGLAMKYSNLYAFCEPAVATGNKPVVKINSIALTRSSSGVINAGSSSNVIRSATS